ncbi:dispersed protein family protein 1 [Trypanosoma cruzi Dm28c]|uniref:Dispersed protein family protein 1 n=1 Tax=Trypanosoma cruzi Dm28c TaxID=1416333 RepID=V5APY3_TRYCR|nr:dispersed protein family protein 1 [Trypanosoma cruzi Dm28c]
MPAVHAVVLRLRGGTVDRAITVGRAVDTVLMDGVYITNGVAVVFDVPAMIPGVLRIEMRYCVCDGGAQIYVRGYSGEPASDRSLEASVSGLPGSYCSLVFVYNLPAHTNVTVRDSTIVTPGPMRYSQLSGLMDAVASPLVLHATSLLQSQLRVSNTVLRSLHAGGSAVYAGGGVDLLLSAVVLDGVLLEASGGPTASAMNVESSSRLSLRSHSVFSVTNVSVVSSGGGFFSWRALHGVRLGAALACFGVLTASFFYHACSCLLGGVGESCVPVGAPVLPPPVGTAPSVFVREGVTVRSVFVVSAGASEVTLRHVVLDGVSAVLYVPWMARDGVRIVVQNVSLLNDAVLYVMGGGALRGARAAGSDESGPVEPSLCDVEALNGALVLTGTFPAGSVLTVTDSLLVAARPTPLVYLSGSQSSLYTPVLVLSGLRLVRSVLVVSGVALVTVMTGGRTVVVDGAVLELVGGGVAVDAAVLGGEYELYASARVVASGGAVLRVSGSQVYAAHGLVFDSGVEANASAVVVNDNAGALTDGALLVLRGSASFVSRSWLSVRGNSISGRLLSVPSYPRSAELVQSKLTLHGNAGSGTVVMDGTVALGGAGRRFVVGCLTLNGQALQPINYRSAGIIGEFRPVACGVCDADVSCFGAATRAMSGSCSCRCAEGGYGRDCLPVYLPRVDGCNRTPGMPLLSHTATLTGTRGRVGSVVRGERCCATRRGCATRRIRPPSWSWLCPCTAVTSLLPTRR